LVVALVGVTVWGIWNWTWMAVIPVVVLTLLIGVAADGTIEPLARDAAAAAEKDRLK
jgi:hypothetical protein